MRTLRTLERTKLCDPAETQRRIDRNTDRLMAYTQGTGDFSTAVLLQANAVATVTGTPLNLVTLPLQIGEWDVTGQVFFIPANTTTVTAFVAWTSTTSVTLPTNDTGQRAQMAVPYTSAGTPTSIQLPIARYVLTTPTTLYLSAQANFGVSTLTAFGNIRARCICQNL